MNPLPRAATGSVFGRLTVVCEVEPIRKPGRNPRRRFELSCACGKTTVVQYNNLISGNTTSCGCVHREGFRKIVTKHGMSASKAMYILRGAINRCHNPDNARYYNYGGRGIKVCEEWRKNHAAFAAYLGEPAPGETLERIDNNGDYEPGNVKWASRKEQSRNMRRNRRVVFNGRQMCFADAADAAGLNRSTALKRYRTNGCPEDVTELFNKPIQR